ncbi:MAG: T9SS type A sorting domain-containing protein [Flavobacteriales bacterium]|jgi:hypothetical protein|nr:T9SS type A sorting domain-containing protein [Flavobacteriales bacterium]
MKKLIFPSLLVIGCLSLNSFVGKSYEFAVHNQGNNFFTGGAPASRTGAPGEANCTACHSGTANDGSAFSSLTHSGQNNEYTPGLTYNMTLSINNGSNKNGFQIVALENPGNTNAGILTVTDPTNTVSVTGSGNTYINQTASGTTLNTWNFDWQAPTAFDSGDVTFYYAYNVTNSNSGNGGDQIYLGQLTLQSTGIPFSVESNREVLNQSFSAFYNNNSIYLEFNNSFHSDLAFVKVFNIEGKCVHIEDISIASGENKSTLQTATLSEGIYLVSLFLDNNVVTRKIAIN